MSSKARRWLGANFSVRYDRVGSDVGHEVGKLPSFSTSEIRRCVGLIALLQHPIHQRQPPLFHTARQSSRREFSASTSSPVGIYTDEHHVF